MILTARVVDAGEALRLGIVSRLSGSVVDDALAITEMLCGYGKFGLESTKQVDEPRGVEPGGGVARGEPQSDPGVDQRGDARGG